jgi:hypothetical protein
MPGCPLCRNPVKGQGCDVISTRDTGIDPRGIKIPDKEMKAFEAAHLHRHPFHADWNYTIRATPADPATRPDDPT